MQVGVAQERPPYVTFEVRPVEDRERSTQAQLAFKDVDFAIITPMGSKDRVERIASEWFVQLREQVAQNRFKHEWLTAFQNAYNAWKNDQEPPVDGTALRNWPAATPAQIKTMTDLRLRSVEDLAAANEEVIHRLGMGGRALVEKAREWLRSSKDIAPALEELSRLKVRNNELESQVSSMATQMQEMQAMLKTLVPAGAAGIASPTISEDDSEALFRKI
jgi:hypothetical protein